MRNIEWIPYTWYCSNCGSKVSGLKNANGDVKVQCGKCGMVMVRKFKGRRHGSIEFYVPKGA